VRVARAGGNSARAASQIFAHFVLCRCEVRRVGCIADANELLRDWPCGEFIQQRNLMMLSCICIKKLFL